MSEIDLTIKSPLSIYTSQPALVEQADHLSHELSLPVIETEPQKLPADAYVLVLNEQGLYLQPTGKAAPGAIGVDFIQGASAHRRKYGGGKSQLIAKAIGIKGAWRPQVLDVTAGLGQDSFVLATLGCQITLLERSPIIFHLLKDGISRGLQSPDIDLLQILQRMQLFYGDGREYLMNASDTFDVIYLDPMFPERKGSADVKKAMKAFQSVVGSDVDAGELLPIALDKARYRVVIKRPRKAPSMSQQFPELKLPEPSLVLSGKSTRYDIYTLRKMPT